MAVNHRARILALLVALASGAVGWWLAWHGSARPIVGRHSVATLGAMLLALGFFGVSIWLTLARDETWRQLAAWAVGLQHAGDPILSPRLFAIFLITALVGQGVLLTRYGVWNRQPRDDQVDYLNLARAIADRQGFIGLTAELFRGEFPESNRHPLYLGLLALRPDFVFGKILSAGLAALVILTSSLLTRRRWGADTGSAVAMMLAVNQSLLHSGALIACETLLTLLVTWAWYTALGPAPAGRNLGRSLKVGGLLGLAYLTKGTALLWGAGYLLVEARRPASLTNRLVSLTLGCLAFTVLASPLLVRNQRRFGQPFYSFNNKLLFADSFEAGRELTDLGAVGNIRRFLQDHSLMDAARRLIKGMVFEAFVILRALGPAPWDAERLFWGVLLAGLAFIGLAAGVFDRFDGQLILAWLMISWLIFGWYQPIAASDRFILPLVPPLTVLASVVGVRVLTLAVPRTARYWFCAILIANFAVALVAGGTCATTSPFPAN